MAQVQAKGTQEPGKVTAEVLLVDNNSTDGSPAILEDYAQRFPDLIRVLQCKKQGASAARNLGLSAAAGKWIQFLDADDELLPGKIATQLQHCPAGAAWIIAAYYLRYPDKTTTVNHAHKDPWKGLVYRYRIGNVCANLYRRAALTYVGNFDESLINNEDPELHFRLLKSGLAYCITEQAQTIYHQHDNPTRLSRQDAAGGQVRRAELLVAVNRYLSNHRPGYWAGEAPYFRGALLRALRMLATYAPEQAARMYERELYRRGEERQLLPIVPKHLQYLHWAFGFRLVERIRTRAGHLRRWFT